MTGSADRGQAAERPGSLFDKLWDSHVVVERPSGDALLWIDRHFVHEGSFHAFNQLQARGGTVAEGHRGGGRLRDGGSCEKKIWTC